MRLLLRTRTPQPERRRSLLRQEIPDHSGACNTYRPTVRACHTLSYRRHSQYERFITRGPAIAGGSSRSFPVPNSACGIPASAAAYSLNVTVVPSGLLGYVTVYPAGQAVPLASTLNSLDGRVKANAAIVPAGANGAISIFASHTTHLVLDINGYYIAPTASTLAFFSLPPCRIADTRGSTGPLEDHLWWGAIPLTPVRSSACNVPATAKAYSLNFTAVPQGALGYITTSPTGVTRP